VPVDRPPPTQKACFGIVALLCALQPVLFLGYAFFWLSWMPYSTLHWLEIAVVLFIISIPCAIAGLVFGILGRKTKESNASVHKVPSPEQTDPLEESRRKYNAEYRGICAGIGLVISLLYIMPALALLMIAFILYLFP
jgi:hypothetical protein